MKDTLIQFHIDDDIKKQALLRAEKELVSLSHVMRELLKDWLESPETGCRWINTDIPEMTYE